MKYVVLLRGVNVGGNNKVSMSELKRLFEKRGFLNVQTYLNSGNIVFESGVDNVDSLKMICETIIANAFGLNIAVVVVSGAELSETLKHAPDWWNNDERAKHNAIFVIPPADTKEIFEQVGECRLEFEKVAAYGRIIFWSAPLVTFSRARWSKIVGTQAYNKVTIRNASTTINLSKLAN
ncbi:MAG: DUF1697 domain-containing protein [Nitrososphaerota archaeon]|nr:DUF1697 domain-containing protein [Nitrososphaerota archaeon]